MKKALECGSRFFPPGGKPRIGNKDDAPAFVLEISAGEHATSKEARSFRSALKRR
jgi:hypothetical protein